MKRVILIICCLVLLVGCSNSSNTENLNDKERINSEVEFFSSKIAYLLNALNNINLDNYELYSKKLSSQGEDSSGKTKGKNQSSSQGSGSDSKEESKAEEEDIEDTSLTVTGMQSSIILKTDIEDINWDEIKSEVEIINSSWAIATIDLINSNVPEEDISKFEKQLNETVISIKNEDKASSMNNLVGLYSYVPKFLNTISANNYTQNIEETKYYILTGYAFASQEMWSEAEKNIQDAENAFISVSNNKEYTKNRDFKVRKTDLLIKELKNSISSKDKKLFFMKYKNLMESINTL